MSTTRQPWHRAPDDMVFCPACNPDGDTGTCGDWDCGTCVFGDCERCVGLGWVWPEGYWDDEKNLCRGDG